MILPPEFSLSVCQQNAPRKIMLEIHRAGKPVAQATVDVTEAHVFLLSLHVAPPFRRKGLATYLMQEIRSRWPHCTWDGRARRNTFMRLLSPVALLAI